MPAVVAKPSSTAPWRVLLLMLITQAVLAGFLLSCFTLLIEPWTAEFRVSRASVLSAMSLHLFASGAWAVVLGRLIDIGPSRYLVTAGLGLFATGILLLAETSDMFEVTLVYLVVFPIAYHLAGPLAAMTLIARNFTVRRGMALGFGAIGVSLGGICLPLLFAQMLGEFGWRETLRVLAAITIVILMPLSHWTLRHERRHSDLDDRSVAPAHHVALLEIVRQGKFLRYAAALFMAFFGYFGIQSNIAPFIGDVGGGPTHAATIISLLSLAAIMGKLVAGVLADHVENRLLFSCASILSAIGVSLLIGDPSFQFALIGFLLLGFGFGAYLPLNASIAARIFGPHAVGSVLGATSLVVTFCAAAPVVAAALRDWSGSYDLTFMSGAALSLCSIPLIMSVAFEREEPVR